MLILIAYIGKNLSNVLLIWVRIDLTIFQSYQHLWFVTFHFRRAQWEQLLALHIVWIKNYTKSIMINQRKSKEYLWSSDERSEI